MKKIRGLAALSVLLLLGAAIVFPVQAQQSEDLSGKDELPRYQLPEGFQVSWGKEEADSNQRYQLYLPKEEGLSYQYPQDRLIAEDEQGVTLEYRYGEQVEIPASSLEGSTFPNVFLLEGDTCCLLSTSSAGITARMPDEDVQAVIIRTNRFMARSFTEVEDSQGDTTIHVTGKEPGNDYVNAYDSAGNKLATMKFWVENLQTGEKMFAFCLEPEDYTPKSGEWYTSIKQVENAGFSREMIQQMRKVLYYGYEGPGNLFDDDAVGLVTTHLALGHIYTGKTKGYRLYEPFLEQLEKLENPYGEASLTEQNLIGTMNHEGQLETPVTTLKAFEENQFHLNLPDQVTIHFTTGEFQTGGQIILSGGQSFYFTAPVGCEDSIQAENIRGTYQEPKMYLVTPRHATRQSLLGVKWENVSQTISLNVNWENPRGEVTVEKKDVEGNPLKGAEFSITSKEDILLPSGEVKIKAGTMLGTVTTDETGKGIFYGLDPGTYLVAESKPPAGYLQAQDQEITLSSPDDLKKVVTVVDEENLVKIRKYRAGTKIPLQGAVFQIWNVKDMKKSTYTTDEMGEILLRKLTPGIYQYQEVTAPEGYLTDRTVYSFEIGENGHPTDSSYEMGHEIYNDCTQLEVLKVDGSSGHALKGALLILKDHSGKEVARWKSGEKAQRLEALRPGSYTLEELEAPSGYLKAQPMNFTLEEMGDIQKVVMKNYPYGELTVSKTIRTADIIWAHGNPTFFFTVEGNDLTGQWHKFHGYVQFTEDEIAECTDSEGMATMSWTFKNLPPGQAYTVTEEPVKDYRFVSVSGSGEVRTEGKKAIVDLTKKPTGQQVVFCNEKTRYDGFKHNDLKINTFVWKNS